MKDHNDGIRDQDLEAHDVEDQQLGDQQLGDQDLLDLVAKVREEYHDPPATPREAMWSQIVAHVDTAQDSEPASVEPGRDSVPLGRSRFAGWGSSPWWTAAAAGLALLVVGYGLGRGAGSTDDPAGPTVAQSDPVGGDPLYRFAVPQRTGGHYGTARGTVPHGGGPTPRPDGLAARPSRGLGRERSHRPRAGADRREAADRHAADAR